MPPQVVRARRGRRGPMPGPAGAVGRPVVQGAFEASQGQHLGSGPRCAVVIGRAPAGGAAVLHDLRRGVDGGRGQRRRCRGPCSVRWTLEVWGASERPARWSLVALDALEGEWASGGVHPKCGEQHASAVLARARPQVRAHAWGLGTSWECGRNATSQISCLSLTSPQRG